MRKSTVLKAVLFLALGYFVLQLVSFKSLFRQNGPGEVDQRPGSNPVAMLDLVYTFITRCQQQNIPVFVIEPVVLEALLTVSEVDAKRTCVYLCEAGEVISLGVFGEDWEKKGSLLQELKELELNVFKVTDSDPRKLSPKQTVVPRIPSHYFVHVAGSTRPLLHVVVFHLRGDNFLWHSRLLLGNKTAELNIPSDSLTFGKTAAAYDRFPLRRVRADGILLYLPHTIKEFLVQVPWSTFIECNYQRAQRFFAKYGEDTSDEAQQFQRKARQLLSRAKELLDDLGVPFWLSSGTCLGWFRQCGIIPYSKDIDFGVFIKDYQEDIVSAFESRGFTLKHIFGKESDSYELSFKAGEIKVDIFFFYEDESNMWNGGTDARTGQKYKYYFPKFSMCWTEFLQLRVRVPCSTQAYVMANYGKNWNTPVKQWDWKTSPANVKENGVWPREEWDSLIQVYE